MSMQHFNLGCEWRNLFSTYQIIIFFSMTWKSVIKFTVMTLQQMITAKPGFLHHYYKKRFIGYEFSQ